MTPFYFGEGDRRLLGIYDPAENARLGTPRAVVFCGPWGPEYLITHGALRRLALNLSSVGQHALRFDYFGVGDSAGEIEEGDLEGWLDDIEMAVEELKGMVGAGRVSLVGIRLGAALAAEVASRRSDIDRLALWDPVVSGPAYLEELNAEHAAWVQERTRYVPLPPTDVPNRLCHPLPPKVEKQIATIDLARSSAKLKQKILLVMSEDAGANEQIIAALAEIPSSRLTVEQVMDHPPWRLSTMGFGGPMPSNTLKRITAWMG